MLVNIQIKLSFYINHTVIQLICILMKMNIFLRYECALHIEEFCCLDSVTDAKKSFIFQSLQICINGRCSRIFYVELGILVFQPLNSNQNVKILCDNSSIIYIAKNCYTGKLILDLLSVTFSRNITRFDIEYIINYIATPKSSTVSNWIQNDNQLADSLFREKLADFLACCQILRRKKKNYMFNIFPSKSIIVHIWNKIWKPTKKDIKKVCINYVIIYQCHIFYKLYVVYV